MNWIAHAETREACPGGGTSSWRTPRRRWPCTTRTRTRDQGKRARRSRMPSGRRRRSTSVQTRVTPRERFKVFFRSPSPGHHQEQARFARQMHQRPHTVAPLRTSPRAMAAHAAPRAPSGASSARAPTCRSPSSLTLRAARVPRGAARPGARRGARPISRRRGRGRRRRYGHERVLRAHEGAAGEGGWRTTRSSRRPSRRTRQSSLGSGATPRNDPRPNVRARRRAPARGTARDA